MIGRARRFRTLQVVRLKEISRKRFGYHVVYDVDMYDAIGYASENGFGYIVPDLMIPRFFPEQFSQSDRRRIREAAQSKNVSISFHAPSDYLNVGTLYPEVRRAVLDRMKSCLDFTGDVEAQRFTMHVDPPYDFVLAGHEGTFLKDHWTTYKNAIEEGMLELIENAPKDVLICVENDQLSKIVIDALEEPLQTGKLFLTWDIPKSHTLNGKPIREVENFLMRHLDKVRECHIHDQRPGKYSHDAVGVGKIDFSHYLNMMLPMDVHFTIEVRPREDALKSLKTLENILVDLGWLISDSP
jgi:sugar phosphate isomerase/epimerase